MKYEQISPNLAVSANYLDPSLKQNSGIAGSSNDFRSILGAAQKSLPLPSQPVQFSLHAQNRLRSRNIIFSTDDIQRLQSTVDQLSAKGAKQSLVLMKLSGGQRAAMVVSPANRVVITALDGESMKDNVFTNIDSASIVD